MTPEEKEKFYDEEIAPKLLELGQKCQDNDISFFALVEYSPKESGYAKTQTIAKEHSLVPIMLASIAKNANNIDAFAFSIISHLRKNDIPHSSCFLLPYLACEPKDRKNA